jgi:hypothetical protein
MNGSGSHFRIAVALAVAAFACSACSAHKRMTSGDRGIRPVSVARVQSAFRSEGIPLRVTVDFRTLSERKIAHLTRSQPQDVGVQRVAKERERAWFELVRRGAAKSPVMWLDGGQLVTVIVWQHIADAQAQVASAPRAMTRGARPSMVAVLNVVVVSAGDATPRAITRVARAVAELRRA